MNTTLQYDGGIQTVRPLQQVYLDFDGESTSYRGEILTIDDVEVEDSRLSSDAIATLVARLNEAYAGTVIFVTDRPATDDYSTVYVGHTDAFGYRGLAETIDIGNQVKNDNAFVNLRGDETLDMIQQTVAHEVDHLLGTLDHGGEGLAAYAAAVDLTVPVNETQQNWVIASAGLSGGCSRAYVSGTASDFDAFSETKYYVKDGQYVAYRWIPQKEYCYVESGGIISSADVRPGATLIVSHGGVVSSATLATDTMGINAYLLVRGKVSRYIGTKGGSMIVYDGGVVTSAVDGPKGEIIVSSGGLISGFSATGTRCYVRSGGTASVVSVFGALNVSGVAEHVQVLDGGKLILNPGAILAGTNTQIAEGGLILSKGPLKGSIRNGQVNCPILQEGRLGLGSGMFIGATQILSGAKLYLIDGGRGERITVDSGSWCEVASGGILNTAIVKSSALMFISSGGSAGNVELQGALLNDGTIKGITVVPGGFLINNGTIKDITVASGGVLSAHVGSIITGAQVAAGGKLWLNAQLEQFSGTVDGISYQFSDRTIANFTIQGSVSVYTGAKEANVHNLIVQSGAVLSAALGGRISGCAISSGGTMTLNSDGIASGTRIAGGEMFVSAGGSALEVSLDDGTGTINGLFGGGTIQKTGHAIVSGVLSSSTVSNGGQAEITGTGKAIDITIDRGGSLTVQKDGQLGTAKLTSGGILTLQAGAKITGTIHVAGTIRAEGTLSAASTGKIQWDLTTATSGLVLNLEKLKNSTWNICVGNKINAGNYKLGTAAAGFTGSFAVSAQIKNNQFFTYDSILVGESLHVGNRCYTLTQNSGGDLSLSVTKSELSSIYWTGLAGNNRWNDPGNWDLGRIPQLGDAVTIQAGTVLMDGNQSGNLAFAGVYQMTSLTLGSKATLLSYGISQLVLDVRDEITFANGAQIRVRNGYSPGAPSIDVAATSYDTLMRNSIHYDGYISLLPGVYGKGGDGGDGGNGADGTTGSFTLPVTGVTRTVYGHGGQGGGGGGGGYGGGLGGAGGEGGNGARAGQSGKDGASGQNNGGYGAPGGYSGGFSVGGGALDVGDDGSWPGGGTPNGKGGYGGGGNGGKGSTGTRYVITEGSSTDVNGASGGGGGGGGYGGGVLFIYADKVLGAPTLLVNGQTGGKGAVAEWSAKNGLNGENGQGGVVGIFSDDVTIDQLKSWAYQSSTSTAYTEYGHGSVSGTPSYLFVRSNPADYSAPKLNGVPSVSITCFEAVFSWKAASDNIQVAGYTLKVGGKTYETKGLSLSLREFAAGTYNYQIQAYDAAGNRSTWSSVQKFVLKNPVHYGPTQVVLTTKIDKYNATVTWITSATPDKAKITGYEVKYNGKVSLVKGTSLTFKKLPVSTGSTVQVRAVDSLGRYGVWSPATTFTIKDVTAPTLGKVTAAVSGYTGTIAWSGADNVGIVKYVVVCGGKTKTVTSGTSVKFDKLAVGKYNATVQAFDAAGNASKIGQAALVVKDATAPAKITGLSIPIADANYNATLRWNPGTDNSGSVAGYEVRLDNGKLLTSAKNSLLVSKLAIGSHTYQVRAFDKDKNIGAWSDAKKFTVKDMTAPASVSVKAKVDGNTLTLSWTTPKDNVGVTGYILKYGANLEETAILDAGQLNFRIDGIAKGGYQYQIVAVDAAGNQSKVKSGKVKIKKDFPVAVHVGLPDAIPSLAFASATALETQSCLPQLDQALPDIGALTAYEPLLADSALDSLIGSEKKQSTLFAVGF